MKDICERLKEISEEGEPVEQAIVLSARWVAGQIAYLDESVETVFREIATTRGVLRDLVKVVERLAVATEAAAANDDHRAIARLEAEYRASMGTAPDSPERKQ